MPKPTGDRPLPSKITPVLGAYLPKPYWEHRLLATQEAHGPTTTSYADLVYRRRPHVCGTHPGRRSKTAHHLLKLRTGLRSASTPFFTADFPTWKTSHFPHRKMAWMAPKRLHAPRPPAHTTPARMRHIRCRNERSSNGRERSCKNRPHGSELSSHGPGTRGPLRQHQHCWCPTSHSQCE